MREKGIFFLIFFFMHLREENPVHLYHPDLHDTLLNFCSRDVQLQFPGPTGWPDLKKKIIFLWWGFCAEKERWVEQLWDIRVVSSEIGLVTLVSNVTKKIHVFLSLLWLELRTVFLSSEGKTYLKLYHYFTIWWLMCRLIIGMYQRGIKETEKFILPTSFTDLLHKKFSYVISKEWTESQANWNRMQQQSHHSLAFAILMLPSATIACWLAYSMKSRLYTNDRHTWNLLGWKVLLLKFNRLRKKTVPLVSWREKDHCHICILCQFFHLFPSS